MSEQTTEQTAVEAPVEAPAEKVKISVNPDAFTMGDLEDFEEYVGKPLAEAVKKHVVRDDEGKPVTDERGRPETEVRLTAKSMTGLLWVAMRATRPGFSIEDARAVRPSQIEWDEAATRGK